MAIYEIFYMSNDSDFARTLVIYSLSHRTVKSSARPYYDNYFTDFSNIFFIVEPGFGQGRKLLNTHIISVENKLMSSAVIVPGNNFQDIRLAKLQKEKFPCESDFLNNSDLLILLVQMSKPLKKL